jgi:hypothetical protein
MAGRLDWPFSDICAEGLSVPNQALSAPPDGSGIAPPGGSGIAPPDGSGIAPPGGSGPTALAAGCGYIARPHLRQRA